jgi:P pilus assembly chaperone PapD
MVKNLFTKISLHKISLISLVGTLGFTSFLYPAVAQTFTVSPMVTISESKGGQSKGSINVTNNGREPLRVRVYAESFTYDRKKGFLFTSADGDSAVPYVQFSPREMEIPPGVTRSIRVGVTLPPSAQNKEYRTAIFVENLQEKESVAGSNVVSIKARVASIFFIGKGIGSNNIKISTAVWDVASKKVSLLIDNQGNRSAFPEISWRIEKSGQEISKDAIRGVVVQAQNSREVLLQTAGKPLDLTSGEYKISGTIVTKGQNSSSFNIVFVVP